MGLGATTKEAMAMAPRVEEIRLVLVSGRRRGMSLREHGPTFRSTITGPLY